MKINTLLEDEKVKVNVKLDIEILWRDPAANKAEETRREMIKGEFKRQAKDLAVMIHNIITGKEETKIIKP